ncbi:Imm51 family immunity protein [Chitinophaga niabensis]|uniref:Immunity protein 51 n=1 Tax=Chitinophaga niabensis TaxID=536979 RepID=A0A1N6IZ93_9BACT|nr:Imm51 family immunity protein [Chitinophaga niabensis]SIO37186.1 Immunity protein 51 [Chitinophaga niabensis]
METNKHYPFTLRKNDDVYSVSADLESDDLYNRYYTFFKKHDYEGNGYCWEGHITQILEKLDEDLLSEIEFDPEAGGFYAYFPSAEAQLKFANLLSPIFSDMDTLEEWVLQADRDRVDD